MLERAEIEKLIPHQGAMCLLDRVRKWDEHAVAVASVTHRDPRNPLRSSQGLRSISLCEYGAQAMALHGALLRNDQRPGVRPTQGMLVTLRAVRMYVKFVDSLPGDLIVTADRVHAIDGLVQYEFRVTHDRDLLVEGRATVALQLPSQAADESR